MILSMILSGNKFVIKRVDGVRKQFLILNGETVLGFVTNGEKFANCASYTAVTANVDCKVSEYRADTCWVLLEFIYFRLWMG